MEVFIDIKVKNKEIEEWDTLRCDISRGQEYILGHILDKIKKLSKLVKELSEK